MKKEIQKHERSNVYDRHCRKRIYPIVPGFAAFTKAYKIEQATNRKQEKGEDKTGTILSGLTLCSYS